MAAQKDQTRRTMTLVFVIVLGLVLGMAFKQVRLGLIFGLVLGFLAISLRRR